MVNCQSFTMFSDISQNSLFSGDGKVKFSKLSLLLCVRGFSIYYNSQTPFSETAFYYGLSQLAQLTQPNGNCSHTLTAETSSWSVLPRHAAAPCGLQLFLHSKAVICSQPACLQSVSRNPDVSLSITVLEYSTVSKQPLTHRTRETSSRAMVIRTGSLEQFKLCAFIKQHLKSTSLPTKLCYLSCMYLQTTSDITVTSHFHNSCVEQEM